jgi:predicted RNA-binding Zn-ribbon protein involved in translation (DUF1610 family)
MSILKPVPVIPQPAKMRCPICGETTYSRGGIHPQCAIQQADEPRTVKLRADRKKAAKIEKPRQRAWNKKCPGCGIFVHVRLTKCGCGHKFATS